jgi:hypothetical protein
MFVAAFCDGCGPENPTATFAAPSALLQSPPATVTHRADCAKLAAGARITINDIATNRHSRRLFRIIPPFKAQALAQCGRSRIPPNAYTNKAVLAIVVGLFLLSEGSRCALNEVVGTSAIACLINRARYRRCLPVFAWPPFIVLARRELMERSR